MQAGREFGVSPPIFYVTLLLAWLALFIVVPALLAFRGWVASGGLMQLVAAFSPMIWHGVFWPDETGTFLPLVMMLLPLPLCLIAAGMIANLFRAGAWVFRSVRNRRGL